MAEQKSAHLLSQENAVQAVDSLDRSAQVALDNVTDRVRKLSLAGIAIVWLFKQDTGRSIVLAPLLMWGLAALVFALVLDFLQAFFTALGWWLEINQLVGKDSFDTSTAPASWLLEDVKLPYKLFRRPRTTWPIVFFKSFSVGLAYALIGCYLVRRLWVG